MSAETCTGRNGSYCCQLLVGHDGQHSNTFRTATGVKRAATWAGPYSSVRFEATK